MINKKATASSERTCFVCHKVHPKHEMVRFVLSPDSVVVPDVLEKLPGRGVWMVLTNANLQKSIDQKLFSKAFKEKAVVPDDLKDQVENAMRRQAISLLGLARKAGAFVGGFEKVKDVLTDRTVAMIFEGSGASDNSKNKLYRPQDDIQIVSALSSADIGSVFGMDNVVFAALLKSKISVQIVPFMVKYNAFKTNAPRKDSK